ncbi:Imm43 family immunity protein [Pectobacterium polaris]|uniref:Imm43 family immunity protein n=1 Tax=Pectobacterium polaris TaxID=2042057 RepID=UPI00240579BF|nr:Imm43 family immunity protein [Pectobacterium polaris]MDG0803642.1 Imm43 family immunity protein [Pectobacterium polaris]
MYYVLMNDYSSSLIPKYLHALVDTEKQVSDNWEYEGSKYSFPNYILDDSCPDDLFLLCRRNIGALKFNYYNHGMGHIMSDAFFEKINGFNTSRFVAKNITAVSIKDGATLRSDLKYVYFIGDNELIDTSGSKLEEDRRGNLVPYDLKFNGGVDKYDIFSISKTLLHHFLFVSESVADLASKIKGIKVIPMDKALDNYCIDYRYDLLGNKKITKRKLP